MRRAATQLPPAVRTSAPRRAAGLLGAVLSAGLLLSGCAAPSEAPAAPGTESTETPSAQPVSIPGTPVGEKTQWVLDVLNADEDTTAAQWEAELDQSFLDAVPAADLATQLNAQFRPAQPFVATAYEGSDRETVTTLAGALGDPLEMVLTLNPAGKIVGMVFRPVAEP